MDLTPSMQNFILHCGEMGPRWGMNRSVAQIFALLHVASDPLTAEEISTTLSLARSNVSTGLRELQGWKVIRANRQLGDRRDWFTTIRDMNALTRAITDHRRARDLHPTLAALAKLKDEAAQDGTPGPVALRMTDWHDALDEVDRLLAQTMALTAAERRAVLDGGLLIDVLGTDEGAEDDGAAGEGDGGKKTGKKKKK
ncbi:GbsR/MarR family transcriptional regulator [Pseudooceanicola aestuarii]|uniref:GbsR/MarR family transcriptional regulator n=1 Tax=Pseudooceanicola aestuarii TaxID=2697319 RepID=UPI0013D0C1BD|nr:MarR family transcriptional regulator [Pseudooceanicola aestuarii]